MYPLIDGDTYYTPDSALTFTTTYGHPIGRMRLHSLGGWAAENGNIGVGEWVQADLGTVFLVSAISTQGYSGTGWSRVSHYKISVSVDGSLFTLISDGNDDEVVLEGNLTDENELVVRNELPSTVEARVVRLIIVDYNIHASLRWDIEGCPVN